MHRCTTSRIHRVVTFGLGVVVTLLMLAGTADATPAQGNGAQGNGGGTGAPQQSSALGDCNGTHLSDTGHGANTSGSYDNTCDGSASANGNGDGAATGRPCAGCVGNADDKNPPGQAPDGSDHNNGYECDGNAGIAKTNPAHTGCSESEGSTGGSEGSQGSTGAGDGANTPGDTSGSADVPPTVVGATETDPVDVPSTAAASPADEGAVLGDSFAAGRSPGGPEAAPAAAVVDDAPRVAASPAAATGHPTEVLGVQYSRPESGVLAFTGVHVLSLALVGLVLCLLGGGLVLASRKEQATVSVAARLAGF